MLDYMREQAKIAPSIDDATIRRRLLRKIDEIGLPEEAKRMSIRRTARPREIRIRVSYPAVFEFPFYKYVHTFNLEASQPL